MGEVVLRGLLVDRNLSFRGGFVMEEVVLQQVLENYVVALMWGGGFVRVTSRLKSSIQRWFCDDYSMYLKTVL
eukprot:c24212_g3_i1 orf=209-427(+)